MKRLLSPAPPAVLDSTQHRLEELVPFGEVTAVGERFAFRAMVRHRLDENNRAANVRIVFGRRGSLAGHDCWTDSCRAFWSDREGWVGMSGPNRKAIERMLESIGPLVKGRLEVL